MRPITAEELLAVWEEGASYAPHERALAILTLVSPAEDVEQLPIAERDARLLRFREQAFGRAIEGLVECPSCRNTCELSFRTSDILPREAVPSGTLSAMVDGVEVRFRLPTTADLSAVMQTRDDARTELLRRCLVVSDAGSDANPLSTEVLDAIEAAMEQADPASTRIEVTCPFCGHHWLCGLDAGAFLWSEIETWGRRVLAEVHVLASAYGWREADILSMSAWRRRRYIEMTGA